MASKSATVNYPAQLGVHGYGTSGTSALTTPPFQAAPKLSKSAKKKVNWIGIVCSFLVPWTLYATLSACTSFGWRFRNESLAYVMVAAGLLFVCYLGRTAYSAFRKWNRGDTNADPSWLIFLFLTSLVAAVMGILLGNLMYNTYMFPTKQLETLRSYPDVDPSKAGGSTYMDAGQVIFKEGAFIDATRSIGFKSGTMYCVAPITIGGEQLPTYDFWAVGTDCCGGNPGDFHCGAYWKQYARGGLREMDDDDRSFYRLAVQGAEASYHIQAPHPLFFRWTEDPSLDLRSMSNEVSREYVLGILVYLIVQAILVIFAMLAFSKFGFQRH